MRPWQAVPAVLQASDVAARRRVMGLIPFRGPWEVVTVLVGITCIKCQEGKAGKLSGIKHGLRLPLVIDINRHQHDRLASRCTAMQHVSRHSLTCAYCLAKGPDVSTATSHAMGTHLSYKSLPSLPPLLLILLYLLNCWYCRS